MTGTATVSVIIPAFNAERFLAEALRSALEQSRPAEEVIVVDDGSTDATAAIARGTAGVTLVRTPHAGVSAARNSGVAASAGDYLAFLDADDLWDPAKLAKQVDALDGDPEAGVAMCRHTYAFEGPIPTWFRGPRDGKEARACLLIAGLVRRSAWERVGPFDTTLSHGEDGDWLFRAKDLGIKVAVIDEPLMTYRIHSANSSGNAAGVREGILRSLRDSVRRKHAGGVLDA